MNINPISSVDSKPISSVSGATNANSKNTSREGETGEVSGFLDKLTALLFHSQSETESDSADLAALSAKSAEIPTELLDSRDLEAEPVMPEAQDGEPIAHSKHVDMVSLSTLDHEANQEPSITTAQVMNQGDELLGRLQQANQTLLTNPSGKNLPKEESALIDVAVVDRQDNASLEDPEFSTWDNLETAFNQSDLTHSKIEFSDQVIDESGEPVIQWVDGQSNIRTQDQHAASQNEQPQPEEEGETVLMAAGAQTEHVTPFTQGDAHVRHEPSKSVGPNGQSSYAAMAGASQPITNQASVSATVTEAPFTTVPSTPVMDSNVLKVSLNGSVLLGKEKEPLNSDAGNEHLLAQQLASAAGQSTTAQSAGLRSESVSVQGQPLPLALNNGAVADEMAERVQMMMSKNLKNIDIRLDPPELGRLHIRMNIHSDGTSVQFTVSNAQARDVLEQSMPRLREMLAQQGVQLADTSVQQQNAGQQQRYSANDSESRGTGGHDPLGSDENIESDIKLDLNVTTKRDGISYYA